MKPETTTYRLEVTQADVENVRRIVESTGFFSAEEVQIAIELVQDRLTKGQQSDYHFVFAEQEGRVIGYTCFERIAGTKESYDIHWIAVDNGSRGKGIGKKLMAKTEEEIAIRGGRRIYIETSSRQEYEPTRLFYRRCGYQQEALLKDFYSPGDSNAIYSKEIAAGMSCSALGQPLSA